MLQSFGFVMHLVPLHAEDLVQHALDQVMAHRELPRDLSSFGRQLHPAILADRNQSVALQPAQRHGYRRGGHREPVCQTRRNHLLAFTFSLQNGLEIVFFGNCDHALATYS